MTELGAPQTRAGSPHRPDSLRPSSAARHVGMMDIIEAGGRRFVARFPRLHRPLVTAYQWVMTKDPRDRSIALPDHLLVPDCFFGFHDKAPWSRDGRYLAVHRANPTLTAVWIGLVDRATSFVPLAKTRCWNWQQGSMLQWVGSSHALAFNDVIDGQSTTRVLDLDDGEEHRIRGHVASFSPDGMTAVQYSFSRVRACCPSYGYAHPDDGEAERAFTLVSWDGRRAAAVLLEVPYDQLPSFNTTDLGYRQCITHTAFDPSGQFLAFFHRIRRGPHLLTRMHILDVKGEGFSTVPIDDASHFCWLDPESILVTGMRDRTFGYHIVDWKGRYLSRLSARALTSDGHPSVSPCGRYVVTDTYPDRNRLQRLLLCDLGTQRVQTLAALPIPLVFRGAHRCDFHPRWSPDGASIAVDTAHTGTRSFCVVGV